MNRPRAVLFDLGQVLVRFDWTEALERLAARVPDARADEIAAWIRGPEGPHDLYCTGQLDDAGLLEAIHTRYDPDRELADDWLVAQWNSIFSPMPGALELVDDLRGQCRLGLVSNTNALHFDHLDARLRLSERFDALCPSHRVGALKPRPEIYACALRALKCDAGDALFVDDVEEYVLAARKMGIDALRFEGVDSLSIALRERGLRVRDAGST